MKRSYDSGDEWGGHAGASSDDIKPRSDGMVLPGKTIQKQNMDILGDNKRTISMKVCFFRHS